MQFACGASTSTFGMLFGCSLNVSAVGPSSRVAINWYLIRKPHETSIPSSKQPVSGATPNGQRKVGIWNSYLDCTKFLKHQCVERKVAVLQEVIALTGPDQDLHTLTRIPAKKGYDWLANLHGFGHWFSQSFAREPEPKAAKKDTGATLPFIVFFDSTPRTHWTMTGTVFVLWQEALRLKRWLPQRFLFHPFPSCSPYIYPLLISWWRLGWEMYFVHVFLCLFCCRCWFICISLQICIYIILHILIIFMDNLDILHPFLYMCILTHFIAFLLNLPPSYFYIHVHIYLFLWMSYVPCTMPLADDPPLISTVSTTNPLVQSIHYMHRPIHFVCIVARALKRLQFGTQVSPTDSRNHSFILLQFISLGCMGLFETREPQQSPT